jgi:hypothetical protein
LPSPHTPPTIISITNPHACLNTLAIPRNNGLSSLRSWLSFHTVADEAALRAGTLVGAGAAQAFCVCETLGWTNMDFVAEVQASPWLSLCAQQACDRRQDRRNPAVPCSLPPLPSYVSSRLSRRQTQGRLFSAAAKAGCLRGC